MPTIKDVAKKANVAPTTVSRVLNNRGYISDALREKIKIAMEELDYRPNELARALSKKHTSIIGVIVPSIVHPFFSKVISYLEYYAAENGYKILICNSYRQMEKEIEYIDMLRSNKVAGIVLCSRTLDISSYLDATLPIVSFENGTQGSNSLVSCDNYQGGTLATKHLIECGCKHLVHIAGSNDIHLPADKRQEAFVNVCKENGIQHKVYTTVEQEFHTMDYLEVIERIIKSDDKVDGIFASSDIIAAQVIQACMRHHIRIPQDLKVIGFDDTAIASLTAPMLTSVRQPVAEMCEYTINNIIKHLKHSITPLQTILPVQLIVRQSTVYKENGTFVSFPFA